METFIPERENHYHYANIRKTIFSECFIIILFIFKINIKIMLIKFSTRLFFTFCKFKYYKDLAKQINYVVPNINEELGLSDNQKCWLIGYKLNTKLKAPINNVNLQQIKQPEEQAPQTPDGAQLDPIQHQIDLQVEPLNREQLDFASIYKFAQKHDLDVCLTDPERKQVSLIKLREQIYRKFYYERIFKKKSTAKKHKQIRVPQNIQQHDMLTKVANIRSMISKGEFKFKLYTENSSDKSEKAIKKICQLLGRDADVEIEQHQIKQKTKRRPSIVIERWNIVLDFSSESKVNYDQVNKKWRRYLIDLKVQSQPRKHQREQLNFDGLIDEPMQFQKQVIKEMRQLKVPLGTHYKDYEDIEDALLHGRKEFQRVLFEKQKHKLSKDIGRALKQQNKKKNSEHEQDESEQLQEQQQEEIIEQKQHPSRCKKNSNTNFADLEEISQQEKKNVRKQMKMRTVEDILQEMQKIKGSKIELEAFDVYKIQILEQQLKQSLRMAGYKSKI